MAARICPRCSTRVDERRAKASPFCLSCGAPLGPVEASATFAGKPASSGGSALPWILGGIGLLIVLGVGGAIAILVVASSATPEPAPAPSVAAAGAPQLPKVEDASVSADAAPSATVAKTAPAKLVTAPPPKPSEPAICVTARDARARGASNATALEDQCRTALGFTPPPPRPTTTTTSTSTVGTATADPTVLPPFPRARAQAEVDRVAAGVNAACQRPEGPFGVGSIRVDFEPDGRTGTLSRPPFASGPVGSCISSRFLAIRIGKFDGSRTSIEKSFIIQQ